MPLPLLRAYQRRIFHPLCRGLLHARHEQFTLLMPRQSGKNQLAAALLSALLLAHARRGGSIVLCAPTAHPQARISLERTRAVLEPLARRARLQPRIEDHRIRCGNAEAVFLSASGQAQVAGHTASIALFADEAQDIDPDWFDRQFRPMAASTGAPALLFGTPWDGESLLERAIARNAGRTAAGVPLHYTVTWQEVARDVPIYGQYVERERQRLGAQNPLYLSQYELIASRASASLLSAEALERIRGAHTLLEGPRQGERYVAGLDPAGEGADATVLAIGRIEAGQRLDIVALERWQGGDLAGFAPRVASIAARWGLERLAIDATGLGQPLAAALEPRLGRALLPVTFTVQTKSALGWELIAAAETGRLSLPANEAGNPDLRACWDELRACRRGLRIGGILHWAAPPGRHDDCVAALALALHAAANLPSPPHRPRAPRVARTGAAASPPVAAANAAGGSG
ncbi:hypothetical protein [Tepidiforma sp.]|uniref:phage terminase large subunit family protein n=1 Tax=Tepidiforma sp. TaxID=2682230 RepID=UPI0026126EBE|nr:hypothetical protein [Tepidiforma sp.]MCX7618620.1 hypothetical protein [Tepidiforma sp.]